MNRSSQNVARWTVASLCLVLFCLPLFIFGIAFLRWWRVANRGDLYSFRYPYLEVGLIFLLAAGLASGIVLLRAIKDWSAPVLLVPVVLFLVGVIQFPNLQPILGMISDYHFVNALASGCDQWTAAHHRYPSNDAEIHEALRYAYESQYQLGDKPVPYQIVVANDATGRCTTWHSSRPGIVYYSVSANFTEYWLTKSVLKGREPGVAKPEGYCIHKVFRDGFSRSEQ
jgi:hypothetical protein